MAGEKMDVRAVVFKSGDHWMVQCLEFDVAAQATSVKDVTYQFERAMVAHMVIARENNMEPFTNVPKAPKRYWKMFEDGIQLAPAKTHTFIVNESARPSVSEMRISDLIEQPV